MKVRYKLNGQEVSPEDFVVAGNPNRLQEMLESGRVPGVMTDSVFLEGHCNGSQFQDTPEIGDFYQQEAVKAGVDPKGKVYLSGLAAFPGDPQAWVDGRGDVQRVCEQRGWSADGAVHVPMDRDKVAIPTGGGVATDIIEAEATQLVAETGLSMQDASEKVFEKRKPHWCKEKYSGEPGGIT